MREKADRFETLLQLFAYLPVSTHTLSELPVYKTDIASSLGGGKKEPVNDCLRLCQPLPTKHDKLVFSRKRPWPWLVMVILGLQKAVLLCAWTATFTTSPYTTHRLGDHMIIYYASQAKKPPMAHTIKRLYEGQAYSLFTFFLNLLDTITSWFLAAKNWLTMFCYREENLIHTFCTCAKFSENVL